MAGAKGTLAAGKHPASIFEFNGMERDGLNVPAPPKAMQVGVVGQRTVEVTVRVLYFLRTRGRPLLRRGAGHQPRS